MTHSPAKLFYEWLSERPTAARMAVAVDGDRLLADAGLLGKEQIADRTGRQWRLVVFRGDDLAFRLAYRHARTEKHVLVVLARGTSPDSRIQVSHVSDILAANEGGPPLNLSVPEVFRRVCPKINFPVTELRRFKDVLLERLDAVPEAAKKIIERWGRPDDWGRGQVAALVILLRHPEWTLTNLWPDETDPAAAIAHALQVLLSVSSDSPDLPILRQMLPEAIRPQVKDYLFWLDQPVEQVAAYLLIRRLADDLKLQNPVVQLKGLQLFPLDFPLDKLEPLAQQVVVVTKADVKTWRLIEKRSEEFLTTQRAEKVGSLAAHAGHQTDLTALSSPALLLPQLQKRLLDFFATPKTADLAWASNLSSHPVIKTDDVDLTNRHQQCQAAARLAGRIYDIELRLSEAVPTFRHAEHLLDWYVQAGHHLLELETARALHDRLECDHEGLSDAAGGYLLNSEDEAAPGDGSLAARVRQRLDALDAFLAKLIKSAPEKFASGPRSIVHFIKEEVGNELRHILTGDSERRIWVLLFDGMRYDTWEAVVQPLLGEHFQITGQARFCTIPSYTEFARRSVFAGAPPADWASEKASSRTEPRLLAKNLGLAAHEVKEKLRFVTDADTTKARTAQNPRETNAKPINVLIYPISDECHDYHSDLASFNIKIRQDLLGDRKTGIRGILDDLLRRVKPGDIILATSDHGFVELPTDMAVTVRQPEAATHQVTLQDSVFYRYAKRFTPSQMPATVDITVADEPHSLCVGRNWLKRAGVGQGVRYSHGGVSLPELVIPGARLERVTEKLAAVDFINLPTTVAVEEDEAVELTFSIRNRGNIEAEFEVSARSNLDEPLLDCRGGLAPAASQSMKIRVRGTFQTRPDGDIDSKRTLSAVGIRLRHTDQSGNWRDAVDGIINLPVKVHAKKTKLETDALASFDEV